MSSDGDRQSAQREFTPPPAQYSLRLVQVRSYVIFTQRRVTAQTGTLDQLLKFAGQVVMRNVLFGFWSVVGLIWTPMAIASNRKAVRKLREIAASGAAAPGWFPDPSGRHGARYWDGNAWTDRVSDLGTDALPEQPTSSG